MAITAMIIIQNTSKMPIEKITGLLQGNTSYIPKKLTKIFKEVMSILKGEGEGEEEMVIVVQAMEI